MRTDPFGRELRFVTVPSPLVVRRDDGGDGGTTDSVDDTDETADETTPIGFTGHAAVFNQRTWIPSWWDGFYEEIAPGAFAKTIKEADVRFLVNHNPDLLLARNTSNTLRLSEDDIGLLTDADLAPTTYGEDLAMLLERGDVTQMSFAFETVKVQWEELDDGSELRTLLEVKLWDVSVVTYPAYADTDASLRDAAVDTIVRSMGLGAEQRREIDETLSKFAPRSEPVKATRSEDKTQPAESTGSSLELLKLRQKANAKRFGFDAA